LRHADGPAVRPHPRCRAKRFDMKCHELNGLLRLQFS
jgi:hypothetical protein